VIYLLIQLYVLDVTGLWLTCRRCGLWALQTKGVGAVSERDCTAERIGREIHSPLDAMSALSGQLARRYSLH